MYKCDIACFSLYFWTKNSVVELRRRGLRDRKSVGAQVVGMENKQRDKWSARMAGWLLRGGFEAKQGSSSVEILTPHFDPFCPLASSRKEYREEDGLMRTSSRPSVRYHSSLLLCLSLFRDPSDYRRERARESWRDSAASLVALSLTALMSFSGVGKTKLLCYANESCQRLRKDFCWEDGAHPHTLKSIGSLLEPHFFAQGGKKQFNVIIHFECICGCSVAVAFALKCSG